MKNNYINGFDIIYWINLDRCIKRRQNMESMLSLLPIKNERIIAIDGKNELDENIYGKFICDEFKLNKLEYACTLSHLNTIKKFNESEHNIALIMEDDMTLEFKKYWTKSIEQVINEAPKDWEIIMLTYIYHNKLDNIYTLNDKYIASAGAYLINKKGSKKLMDLISVNDNYKLLNKCHHADHYIYSLLKTYVYKYPYFIYKTDNNSLLHPEHLKGHMYSKKLIIDMYKHKLLNTMSQDMYKHKLLNTMPQDKINHRLQNFIYMKKRQEI